MEERLNECMSGLTVDRKTFMRNYIRKLNDKELDIFKRNMDRFGKFNDEGVDILRRVLSGSCGYDISSGNLAGFSRCGRSNVDPYPRVLCYFNLEMNIMSVDKKASIRDVRYSDEPIIVVTGGASPQMYLESEY